MAAVGYEWCVAEALSSPTILLLSTSDTDLIAARASGAAYRWANPARLVDGELAELLDGVQAVVVRILGGYRAWEDGIDQVAGAGLPAVVISGEQAPDADLMSHSTVPAGVALEAHVYFAQGGVENMANLHAFLSDTLLMTGFGFARPVATPTWGVLERPAATEDDGPRIAVLYYRAQHLAGNTEYIEALCDAIEARGRHARFRCTARRCAPRNPNCSNCWAPRTSWSPRCWPPGEPTRRRSARAVRMTSGTSRTWRR